MQGSLLGRAAFCGKASAAGRGTAFVVPLLGGSNQPGAAPKQLQGCVLCWKQE